MWSGLTHPPCPGEETKATEPLESGILELSLQGVHGGRVCMRVGVSVCMCAYV